MVGLNEGFADLFRVEPVGEVGVEGGVGLTLSRDHLLDALAATDGLRFLVGTARGILLGVVEGMELVISRKDGIFFLLGKQAVEEVVAWATESVTVVQCSARLTEIQPITQSEKTDANSFVYVAPMHRERQQAPAECE